MALTLEQERKFDYFAKLARIDFEKHWTRWEGPPDVARWWAKWCVDGKTNHDRLGRILMHCTGVRPYKGKPNSEPYLFKELDQSTVL